MNRPTINKKTLLRVFITGVFLYLIYTSIEIKDVFKQLQHINLSVIMFAFILNYVGSITMQSLITLKSSNTFSISIWSMDKVNLTMRFYSMILPMAAVSVLRWRRYNILGCSKSHSFILMVQNKILQILFITFFFVLSFTFFQNLFISTFSTSYLPLFITLLILFTAMLYLLGIITGVFPSKLFFKTIIGYTKALPKRISKKLQKIVFKIRSSLDNDHKISKKTILYLLTISLISHVIILTSQYFSAIALNMPITFLELAFARSFVQLLLMFPLTIAGVGVREFGFISTLAIFGISMEEAVALSLILLGFQILFMILGLMVETIDLFKQKKLI